MTKDDIIKMAEKCGISEFENNESQAENILRLATLVAETTARECIDNLSFHGHDEAVRQLDWFLTNKIRGER
jgi:hypothetical protein